MRGASAIDDLLKRHPDRQAAVYAVWEPILPTDWMKPGGRVLARLTGSRVRQYWDPGHLVAAALKSAEQAGKLHPDCCNRDGILWDLVAVYAPGVLWEKSLPEPVFLNGPVVDVARELDAILTARPAAK